MPRLLGRSTVCNDVFVHTNFHANSVRCCAPRSFGEEATPPINSILHSAPSATVPSPAAADLDTSVITTVTFIGLRDIVTP